MTLKLGDNCPHCHNPKVKQFLGSKDDPLPVNGLGSGFVYNLRCDICDWFFIVDAKDDMLLESGK